MLYARGADLRLRVRAAHAATVCATLARRLAKLGFRWSPHTQPIHHILSPICLIADPHGQIELQVIDDARGSDHGTRICTNLIHAGWSNLGQ